MIKIKDYKEGLAEIIASINTEVEGDPINSKPVLSASESSFCKKLEEQDGIQLGGSYPTADTNNASEDNIDLSHKCLLFLLKKVDLSSIEDPELDVFYDHIGDLADLLMRHIAQNDFGCDKDIRFEGNFNLEWEYNYSGFYGASISFTLH